MIILWAHMPLVSSREIELKRWLEAAIEKGIVEPDCNHMIA
jgi:hypothetical protein